VFAPGALILFQGDSITHGGRGPTEDPNHVLGHSYPFLIASEAAARHPSRGWRFVNRGVSGDRVRDLAARWQQDALDHQPDILSILVGANDVGAIMDGDSDDTAASRFRSSYDELLARTVDALPHVRLMLGEPFCLPVGVRGTWAGHMETHAQVVRKLAADYEATLVPYQQALDAAVGRAPAAHWIWDGIHPTYAGQRILADTWLAAVNGTPALG
jgi:lysophospholipase L1-like esterase